VKQKKLKLDKFMVGF